MKKLEIDTQQQQPESQNNTLGLSQITPVTIPNYILSLESPLNDTQSMQFMNHHHASNYNNHQLTKTDLMTINKKFSHNNIMKIDLHNQLNIFSTSSFQGGPQTQSFISQDHPTQEFIVMSPILSAKQSNQQLISELHGLETLYKNMNLNQDDDQSRDSFPKSSSHSVIRIQNIFPFQNKRPVAKIHHKRNKPQRYLSKNELPINIDFTTKESEIPQQVTGMGITQMIAQPSSSVITKQEEQQHEHKLEESLNTHKLKFIIKKTYKQINSNKKYIYSVNRINNFMVNQFAVKVHNEIDVQKHRHQQNKKIEMKKFNGDIPINKFLSQNRNVCLLSPKRKQVNNEKGNQQTNEKISSLFSTDKKMIEDGEILNNDNDHPIQIVKQLQFNNAVPPKLSRNRVIPLGEPMLTLTSNTLASSTSQSTQNQQPLLTQNKKPESGKAKWSVQDYMYSQSIKSPMNYKDRISSISSMAQIQRKKPNQLRFNSAQKHSIKYLTNPQDKQIFDNVLDSNSNTIVKKPKDQYLEASLALNEYFQNQRQSMTRVNTANHMRIYNNEYDMSPSTQSDFQIRSIKSAKTNCNSVSKLAPLIHLDTQSFFQKNFAIKEKESESLQIGYLQMQSDAKELRKVQQEEETVSRHPDRYSQIGASPNSLNPKTQKLMNLILKY